MGQITLVLTEEAESILRGKTTGEETWETDVSDLITKAEKVK